MHWITNCNWKFPLSSSTLESLTVHKWISAYFVVKSDLRATHSSAQKFQQEQVARNMHSGGLVAQNEGSKLQENSTRDIQKILFLGLWPAISCWLRLKAANISGFNCICIHHPSLLTDISIDVMKHNAIVFLNSDSKSGMIAGCLVIVYINNQKRLFSHRSRNGISSYFLN